MTIKSVLPFLLIFIFSCSQTDKKESKTNTQAANFLMPPIPGADVPYNMYSVEVAKGDTFFYKTGSIILFPPNAFVDKEGKIIDGQVQVKYREFLTPIDFFLSGVPMAYDSAGKSYTFESSGMCEVLAYKDGIPVYVNPGSKPEINIASDNNSPGHSIYYLDTVQKKWVSRGTSTATDLSSLKARNPGKQTFVNNDLVEPVKPGKANNKSPVIRINVDSSSFKELLVYDGLQFQLDANETKFNPKDTSEEWKNVELQKGHDKGLYTVKFSNATRIVSYSARPVLQGEDYDKALKIFEKNNLEYKKKVNEQMKQKELGKQYVKDSLENLQVAEENKRIERLNILIEARNKEIEKQNAIAEKQNAAVDKRNAAVETQNIKINRFNKAIRSFQMSNFGTWNFDRAISFNILQVTATFKDESGKLLALTNIAVLYKLSNGIFRFPDNKIEVIKDADHMIIGVFNGMFAYLTFNDYKKLRINTDAKEQIFVMTVVPVPNNNYDFIRELTEE